MSKPSVLIVDDLHENLVSMENILSPLDVHLVTTTSGKTAFHEVLRQSFSLILLDVMMPEINGFELAGLIRQNQASRNIPIIFLTAMLPEVSHELEGYEVGAVDFLYKPIEPVIFHGKIKALLQMELHKQALEVALIEQKNSNATIKALLNTPLFGAILMTPDGEILVINETSCQYFGVKESEMIGQQIYDFLSADVQKKYRHHIEKMLKDKCPELFEESHRKGIYDVHLLPIVNDQGLIYRVAVMSQDITKARHNEQELLKLANHDVLTGLANRSLFSDFQEKSIAQAKRQKNKVVTMFIDLDMFKQVNDTLGHDIGDLLLQSVSKRIQGCLREMDLLARMGGDEFAIILPNITGIYQAGIVAQKILDCLSYPHQLLKHQVHIACSIGIVCYPDNGHDGESLNKAADIAMYYAKENGRNKYCYYDSSIQREAMRRAALIEDLHMAHAHSDFRLFYQPKVYCGNENILSVEALMRWQHPQRGLILPNSFIPIAEECGLICDLGAWALDEACHQAKQWHQQDLPVTVAVNVSAKQLNHTHFLETIMLVLKRHQLPAKYLQLEVTESTVMQTPEKAIQILQKIREQGISIAIDDFGTGYSSLSYLQQLPIDTLKIDLSFVRRIGQSADSDCIVKGIIALAHSLNLSTVAEGVETEQQIDFLRQQECHYLQGYYYSRPIPADEMTEWLCKQRKLAGNLSQ